MTDYIEAMLEAKRLLKVAEDAAMKGDYAAAHDAIESMDAQIKLMLDWFADSLAK